MRRICAVALMMFFSVYFGAYSAIAKEKLVISAQFDEMPSEVQSSETFVKQLYVDEKKILTIKFLKEKRLTSLCRFICIKNSHQVLMYKRKIFRLYLINLKTC